MSLRLLKTNAFRLTLLHALLIGVLALLALAAVYVSMRDQIDDLIDTRLRLETDVLIGLYKSGSMPQLMAAIQKRNQVDDYGRFYFLSTKNTHSNSPNSTSTPEKDAPALNRVHSTRRMADVMDLPPDSPRANTQIRLAETTLSNGATLLIGHEISKEMHLANHTFWLLIGASIVVLAAAIASGVLMGLSVLRRIESINRTTKHIIEHGDLSRRLTVTRRHDEFDAITKNLNQMLDRIEQGMSSMRQVSNNIAHDLRSPLTRLRNRLEVTLLEPRDDCEYRDTMGEAIEDADKLINTFNAILSISRLESGLDRSSWGIVDLVELGQQCAELYQPLAEDESKELFFQSHCTTALIRGQTNMLSQALTNLVDNSIKYSGKGGKISISVDSNQAYLILSVSDTGPGIPQEDRDRVLDRFVRLESERSTPGNGLGLSLVKAIAKIYQADLILDDNKPGLIVTLKIPRHDSFAAKND